MNQPFVITGSLLLGLSSMGSSEAMPGGPAGNPIRRDAPLIPIHPSGARHAFSAATASLNIDERSNPMAQKEWEVTFQWDEKTTRKLDFEVNFDEDSLEPSGARLGPILLDRENVLALLKALSSGA